MLNNNRCQRVGLSSIVLALLSISVGAASGSGVAESAASGSQAGGTGGKQVQGQTSNVGTAGAPTGALPVQGKVHGSAPDRVEVIAEEEQNEHVAQELMTHVLKGVTDKKQSEPTKQVSTPSADDGLDSASTNGPAPALTGNPSQAGVAPADVNLGGVLKMVGPGNTALQDPRVWGLMSQFHGSMEPETTAKLRTLSRQARDSIDSDYQNKYNALTVDQRKFVNRFRDITGKSLTTCMLLLEKEAERFLSGLRENERLGAYINSLTETAEDISEQMQVFMSIADSQMKTRTRAGARRKDNSPPTISAVFQAGNKIKLTRYTPKNDGAHMFRLDFQVNSSNASHYYLLSIARSPEDNGTYSSVMEIDTYESNGTQANEPQRFNNQVADKLLEECNTVMLQHTHKVASLALSVFIKHLMDIVERQTDDKGKPEMQEFLNEYIKGQDAWIQNLAKPDKNGAVLLLNFMDPELFSKHPKAKMCLDFQDPVEGILKSKLKLEIDLDKEGQEIKGVTLKRIGNRKGVSINCDSKNQWYLRYRDVNPPQANQDQGVNLPQANHNIRDAVDKLFKVLDWIRTLKEGAPIDIPGAPEPVPAAAATANQTAAPAAVPNMTVAAGDLNQAASALQVTTPAVATTAAIEATKPLPPVKEFFTKEVFIKTLKTESPEKEDAYYSDLWEQYQKLDPEAKEVVYNLKTEYVGRLQHCLSKGIEYAALDLQEKKLIQALYAAREQSGRKLKLLHCINFQQSYPNRISVQNYLMESLQKTNQPFNVDIDLLTGSPSAYKLTTILCQSRNVKSQEECRRCSDEAAASIQTQLLSGFALDSAQYNLAVDLWMETGKTVADLAICNSLVKEYTKLNAEQKQFITNLQTAKGQTLSACLRFVWETGKELQPSSTLGECIQNIKSGAVAAGPNPATSPAAAATTGAEEKTSWQDMLKGIRGMQSVSSFLNRADLTSLSASSKETEQAFMQNLRTHYSELPVESQRSLDVKDLTQEAQDFITTLERESPEYDRVHSLWLWLYYNQLAADAKEFINTLRQEASLKWGECIAIENKYDNLESTQKKLIQLLRAAVDKQGKKLTLLQCLHLQKTYANLIPAQKTLLESLRESNQLFNEDIQLLSYKPEMYKLLVVLWRNLNNEITLQEIIELAGVYIKNLREGFTQDSEEYNLAVNLWLETGKTVADLAICNSLVKEYTSLSSKQTKFITNLQNGTGQTLSDCLRLLLEIAKSSQKSSIAAYIDSMILKTSAMKQKLQQLIDGVKKSLLQANTSDIVLRFCNWVTNAQNAKATVQHLSYEAQSNKLINRFSFSLESTTWQLEITQSENKLDLKVNEMINGQQQNSGERMGLSIPAGFKLQMQNFALQTSHFVWDFCLQSLIKEIDRISDQGQSEETKAYLEKCKDALRKLNRDRGKSPSKLSFNPIDQKFEIIFDDKTRFWFTIRDNTSIAELTYQVDTEVRLVGNSASETKLFYGPNGESLKINTSIPAQPFLSTCNWYSKALWDNQ